MKSAAWRLGRVATEHAKALGLLAVAASIFGVVAMIAWMATRGR